MMKHNYLIIDGSYFLYFNIFSGWNLYQKQNKIENTDGSFDPTNDEDFVDICLKKIHSRLNYYFNEILPKNDVDTSNLITYFALDCAKKKNWRLEIFPEYKISRTIEKPSEFNVSAAFQFLKNYILNNDSLFKTSFKIIPVSSPRSEGDDIVATLVNKIIKDQDRIFLLANDRDFLQISDKVTQLDMMGQPVTIEDYTDGQSISTKEFTLLKILVGDKSDDIEQIFPRYGVKKCLKLLKDKDTLTSMLKTNEGSIKLLNRNKKLIDFDLIPEEITEEIIKNFKLQTEQTKSVSENSLDLL